MTTFPSNQNAAAAAVPTWRAPAPGNLLSNIATNASTLVKTGAGIFFGFSVNTAGTGTTMAVYDGTSAAGTSLGTFSTTAVNAFDLPGGGFPFATGLFIVTAGDAAANITASYM